MKTIAICAAGGGLTTALAFSHDVLRLLTLHTATAHTAFAALHNLHRCDLLNARAHGGGGGAGALVASHSSRGRTRDVSGSSRLFS